MNVLVVMTVLQHLQMICCPRLQGDTQLGRFWQNRGEDGIAREKQLLVDYLCSVTGGSMYYTGRDMKTTHKGM